MEATQRHIFEPIKCIASHVCPRALQIRAYGEGETKGRIKRERVCELFLASAPGLSRTGEVLLLLEEYGVVQQHLRILIVEMRRVRAEAHRLRVINK